MSKDLTKKLFNICIEGGRFDEEKFKVVLEYISSNYPGQLTNFRKEVVKFLDQFTVKITSAYPLGGKEKSMIEQKIQATFYEYNVDPEILGGLIIKVNDNVVDNSLSTKINQLT